MRNLETATASNAHLNYAFRLPIAPERAALATEVLNLFDARTKWTEDTLAYRSFQHVYPEAPAGPRERNDLAMALHRAFRKTFDWQYGDLDEIWPLRGVHFSVDENDIVVRCEQGGGLWEIADVNTVVQVFQKHLGAPSISFDFQFAEGEVVFGGGTSTCRAGKKPVVHSPYVEDAAKVPWDIGSAVTWERLREARGYFEVFLDVGEQWGNFAAACALSLCDNEDRTDWRRLESDLVYRRGNLCQHPSSRSRNERALCDVLIDRIIAVGAQDSIAYLSVTDHWSSYGNNTVQLRSEGDSDLAAAAVLIGAYQDFLWAERTSVACRREHKNGRLVWGGSVLLEPGKAPEIDPLTRQQEEGLSL